MHTSLPLQFSSLPLFFQFLFMRQICLSYERNNMYTVLYPKTEGQNLSVQVTAGSSSWITLQLHCYYHGASKASSSASR